MPRSPRAAARRRILNDLAAAKRTIAALSTMWTTNATTTVPAEGWRDRLAREYPEAQARFWAATVAQLDDLNQHLGRLREHALTEYHLTIQASAAANTAHCANTDH